MSHWDRDSVCCHGLSCVQDWDTTLEGPDLEPRSVHFVHASILIVNYNFITLTKWVHLCSHKVQSTMVECSTHYLIRLDVVRVFLDKMLIIVFSNGTFADGKCALKD